MRTKIVYVVVSTPSDIYLEQAWASVWSLKYYNPDAYVTFVVDEGTFNGIKNDSKRKGVIDIVDEFVCKSFDEKISGKERSRILKTTLRDIVNGDFLFIDTDTLITDSIAEVDSFKFHIGMVYDLHSKLSEYPFENLLKREQRYLYGVKLSDGADQFNSGVIYAKDDAIARDFFKKWHDNWEVAKILTDYRDQPSLLKTCEENPNIVIPLSGIYNCQITITIAYLHKAKIIHYYNNIWKRVYITPFMEKTIYQKIKDNGGLSEEVTRIILNCKSEFCTPSMPITLQDVQLGRSNQYKFLLKLFTSHRKLFSCIDAIFVIDKKIIKLLKLIVYYVKKK